MTPAPQGENLPVPISKRGSALVSKQQLSAVIIDFQSDAVELEERPPPRVAKVTLYALSTLIGAIILWTSVSEVDEVVVATGKLVTSQPTMVVQPLETSIIRTLDVTVGEIVHAGQNLATLDPTFSEADVVQQRSRLNAFDAQVKRLEAEMAGRDYPALAGTSSDEQLQAALFRQRDAYHRAQVQNYDSQIAGQSATISAGNDQARILQGRLDTLGQIETTREGLYRRDAGSLLLLLVARDARLDVDADLAAIRGKSAEAEHALKKLTAEKQAFLEDFRRATMEQLVELRDQRDTATEELKKMELRRMMVTLKAPADAVVLDLAQRSVGSVVRDAEPIVTLVPLDVPLEAEVSVSSLDIARIADGMDVRIKLDAYPFQKFGTASGSVKVISRDTFEPTQQEVTAGRSPLPFFRARVALNDTRLRAPEEAVRLLPGMTVSAEIKVGRRTIISYILYPLIKGLDSALREP
ncbi:HlyD family type I secretion periplasmic adaptor subunit [Aliirhizobium smilacinae]|uniref:Membrane fusion protein (MFP) family protein n=1 Tax=Aliirhizobium smilacinae TaxID=1395944 RepID=A0A5C4XMA8_9HYPH|nr:HlyD family type I secretion periplasmic adaptor subunit [Rhizobium smilacinae]TNM63594.1 HlyD family type I secretion periplasmic adaptor subunit [Rhizobium smilacinae]